MQGRPDMSEKEDFHLTGWLPRRLKCLAGECDDRAMYVGNSKFSRTYVAAYWALHQAADRIAELETQLKDK